MCVELWLSVGQLMIHCHLSGNHIGCPGQSDKWLFRTLGITLVYIPFPKMRYSTGNP